MALERLFSAIKKLFYEYGDFTGLRLNCRRQAVVLHCVVLKDFSVHLVKDVKLFIWMLQYSNLSYLAGLQVEDKRPRELIVQEQLLHYLESAYPNILPTDELAE